MTRDCSTENELLGFNMWCVDEPILARLSSAYEPVIREFNAIEICQWSVSGRERVEGGGRGRREGGEREERGREREGEGGEREGGKKGRGR